MYFDAIQSVTLKRLLKKALDNLGYLWLENKQINKPINKRAEVCGTSWGLERVLFYALISEKLHKLLYK